MYSIETQDLSFSFNKTENILNQIQLQAPENSIYGFLGPNGAGKTTTLKLLLGLLSKQQGDIRFFGKPFEKNRIEILKQVGSLIESPSFYGHLSATENLNLLQKVYGFSRKRIPEVLETVGLAHTGKKKTSHFSLGMKQRLGIAIALVNDPRVLILDEPVNGLDPNGIIEVRELLKNLHAQQNITILVSSHLLSEIEKLVTHVGIINKGEMLFQGTLQQLMLKQKQAQTVCFKTSDDKKATTLISEKGLTIVEGSGIIEIAVKNNSEIAQINCLLVNVGIEVYHIATPINDLESIFIDLTQQVK